VQVAGFKIGLNVRIDHWYATQLDIARCDLALNWSICLQNKILNVHFFDVNRFIYAWGGHVSYGAASIDGCYIESAGNATDGFVEWYMDTTYHGMLNIYRVNVDASLPVTLWSINQDNHASMKIWFQDVMTANSQVFPIPFEPAWVTGTTFHNNNSQTILVTGTLTTPTVVEVNGYDLIPYGVRFTALLRPGDKILVTAAACTWSWVPFSAERWHYDDSP
jgi:hypothetical protein